MNEHAAIPESSIAWKGVIGARYRLEQSIRYEYAEPIRDLEHRLMIAPRARHGDQRRLADRLWSNTDAPMARGRDAFGNDVATIAMPHIERALAFHLESTLERKARSHEARQAPSETYDPRFLDDGRLTQCDEALRDVAAQLRAVRDPRERAHAIIRHVHTAMTYLKGVTDVSTTAAAAYGLGQGVCQDFSHIAIALARATGIGARYASGHLIGEGATHAWVEFLIPVGSGFAVLSLDPTYCSETDHRYLVVAIGRDYADVAPTSGVFSGKTTSTLVGRQTVTVTAITYAA